MKNETKTNKTLRGKDVHLNMNNVIGQNHTNFVREKRRGKKKTNVIEHS